MEKLTAIADARVGKATQCNLVRPVGTYLKGTRSIKLSQILHLCTQLMRGALQQALSIPPREVCRTPAEVQLSVIPAPHLLLLHRCQLAQSAGQHQLEELDRQTRPLHHTGRGLHSSLQ